MPYLPRKDLEAMGFRHVGRNVRLSDRAAVYDPERISLGDNVRIDDFCVLAGTITLGSYVQLTVQCNLAGGRAGITVGDFTVLSYGTHVIAQSDDYSGDWLYGPDVRPELKHETSLPLQVGPYALLGAGTMVLPGATIAEGVASGARTLFLRPTAAWTIYVGSPARVLRPRSRRILELAAQQLEGPAQP